MNGLVRTLLSLGALRFVTAPIAAPSIRRVHLPPRGWCSVSRPIGLSIRCLRGQAIIALEGDPRDQLLVAGETIDISRGIHLYVTTETGADLQIAAVATVSKDH